MPAPGSTGRPRRRSGRAAGLVALLALGGAAGCAREPKHNAAPADALAPPARPSGEPMPGMAHDILQPRMARHTRDLRALLDATALPDFAGCQRSAEAIAADSDLARPLTGDATEFNAQLPPRFFDLQDELRKQARALGAAAVNKDAQGVAATFARMSETCVRCHDLYRSLRPAR